MTNEVEKVIYELEKDIKRAQYVDDDYVDCVEVSLLQTAVKLLKQSTPMPIVRCKDCRHLFDGEHTENCCDVLMEKSGWLKEISVSPDFYCASGEGYEIK